jgi:hypothetical protein
MKASLYRLKSGFGLMIIFWMSAQLVLAQATGSQAQSGGEQPTQVQAAPHKSHSKRAAKPAPQPKIAPEIAPALRPGKSPSVQPWEKHLRPAQPQRPLPLALFFMGFTILVVSVGLSVLAFFLFGTGVPLGIITILFWFLFGLTGLLGILLIVSALIMALSVGKKRKDATPPGKG